MFRAVWQISKVLKNHICQGKLVLQTKRESYIKVRTCHHCYGPMKAEENKFFCYNFLNFKIFMTSIPLWALCLYLVLNNFISDYGISALNNSNHDLRL